MENSQNQEPSIKLNIGQEVFEATRDNTTLFQFFGRLAIYNHVFLVFNEEENSGAYIFSDSPVYPEMEEFIVAHEFPQHLGMRAVAQCDVDAWERHTFSDLNASEGVPEGWE